MQESWNEFEFQPDTTTKTRVVCPRTSEKLMYNVVNTTEPLFLIGSSAGKEVNHKVLDEFEI